MLSLYNLSKKYKNKTILDDISVDFDSNLIIINGVNGSGKSTLIKILTNTISKSSGKIKCDGTISYLPSAYNLPKIMFVKDYLLCFIKKEEIDNLMNKYLIPNKRISELSKGNLQKLILLQIFYNDTKYYILDEPLDGLDEFAKELFHDEIKNKIEENKIIIMALHDNKLIEDLNPKIYYMKDGKLYDKA